MTKRWLLAVLLVGMMLLAGCTMNKDSRINISKSPDGMYGGRIVYPW